jgi:hypothetical protein
MQKNSHFDRLINFCVVFGEVIGNFEDVEFVFSKRTVDIPVKTAALLCARFPLVTSRGLLKDSDGKRVGHITDGGYFENTGLETLLHWLNMISPHLKRIESNADLKIKFQVLFFQNSTSEDSEGSDYTKETNKAKEAKNGILSTYSTIFKSFINPWNRGSITRNNLYENLLHKHRDIQIQYHQIKLKRYDEKDKDYPLGWYLSEVLVNQMKIDVAEEQNYESLQKTFL